MTCYGMRAVVTLDIIGHNSKAQFFFLFELVRVISSWLQNREAVVVVAGATSRRMRLADMTYQGTVWGAMLWNTCFADARLAVRRTGFN